MSEKFRIALIGTGMICNCAHLPAINNLRKKGLAEIVACALEYPRVVHRPAGDAG